jgi:peptidoglycan hydrolase CwlO-like protein
MPDGLKDWLGVVALAISLLTSVYAWITSKAKANAEHLKAVDAKLVDLDRRVQSIESELKHLPNKDDVNELKLGMAQLDGTVGRLDESLSGISRTVRRVEGFLMKESN